MKYSQFLSIKLLSLGFDMFVHDNSILEKIYFSLKYISMMQIFHTPSPRSVFVQILIVE